jgi:hypothetical protein
VPAGAALWIEFETTDGSLGGGMGTDLRPRVVIVAATDEIEWQGTRTIELLRRSRGVGNALRWQARAID